MIGETFMLPHGLEAALAAAKARFPQHRAELKNISVAYRCYVGRRPLPSVIRMIEAGG